MQWEVVVYFSRAFDSIHRRKMEQIPLVPGLPQENVSVITMLFKNMEIKVCSPDVLQGDALSPY